MVQIRRYVRSSGKRTSPEGIPPTTEGEGLLQAHLYTFRRTNLDGRVIDRLIDTVDRAQEKQQATERQLQELSDKVAALEVERDQLQRAVESANSGLQVEFVQSICQQEKHSTSFILCRLSPATRTSAARPPATLQFKCSTAFHSSAHSHGGPLSRAMFQHILCTALRSSSSNYCTQIVQGFNVF